MNIKMMSSCLLCLLAFNVQAKAANTQDFQPNLEFSKQLAPSQETKVKKPKLRNYATFNYPSGTTGGKTFLTGIRGVKHDSDVYITGFYEFPAGGTTIPFLYKGDLDGKGKWHVLNYPSSAGVTVTATNLYGPSDDSKSKVQVVGNYKTVQAGSAALGCLYEGHLDGSGQWTTLLPPAIEPVLNTIAHSTMGDLVVGNYNVQKKVSKAFIYDIKNKTYHKIVKSNAKDITAYGIWHHGHNSYTICGGYSDLNGAAGVKLAYLVDWNNKTQQFSNWRSYSYNNDPSIAIVTHFDGITADKQGNYHLTGDWIDVNHPIDQPSQAFFCTIKKKDNAKWSLISYPGETTTSGNSVYKKVVIGSYNLNQDPAVVNGYISTPQ